MIQGTAEVRGRIGLTWTAFNKMEHLSKTRGLRGTRIINFDIWERDYDIRERSKESSLRIIQKLLASSDRPHL